MNQKLETIKIKGKEYVMVNARITYFRSHYPNYSLTSKILEHKEWKNKNDETEYSILIKASVLDENNRVIATGLAQEYSNSTFINKTSYIENCETSAWGRALGNLGIGLDTSVASAEEVQNAIANQKEVLKFDSEKYRKIAEKLKQNQITINKVEEHFKLDKFTKLELQKLN
tara:strand:+ start:91 stop:606 length:516 start_codon:yes stop_codon:yes gene_type:complete